MRTASLERQKKRKNYVDQKQLNKFYKQFWDSNPIKQCFESGEPLRSYRSWHIHHIIEKKPHPEHIFNMDVCVLLTLQKHRLWHDLNEQDKAIQMPKTYQRLLELRLKYNIK